VALDIELVGDLTKLYRLRAEGDRINSIAMNKITDALYEMVVENLSGKILQAKSGQLLRSVKKTLPEMVEEGFIQGSVVIEPATAKAYALEYGGKKPYPIPKGLRKTLMGNLEEDFGPVKKVYAHPPSKAYGYLSTAAEEIEPELIGTWVEVFQEILV